MSPMKAPSVEVLDAILCLENKTNKTNAGLKEFVVELKREDDRWWWMALDRPSGLASENRTFASFTSFPPIVHLKKRLSEASLRESISGGKLSSDYKVERRYGSWGQLTIAVRGRRQHRRGLARVIDYMLLEQSYSSLCRRTLVLWARFVSSGNFEPVLRFCSPSLSRRYFLFL